MAAPEREVHAKRIRAEDVMPGADFSPNWAAPRKSGAEAALNAGKQMACALLVRHSPT